MPRLTPAELQAARKAKAAERKASEQQIAREREEEARRWAERDAWLHQTQDRHAQLGSVVRALYEEEDKLQRKWPNMKVTERVVERTNKTIRGVKDLLRGEQDDFIEDIGEIVVAGDLPEVRDVAMILGELQAALQRFGDRYRRYWELLERSQETVDENGFDFSNWSTADLKHLLEEVQQMEPPRRRTQGR